jgi:hypothetical protein
MTQLSIALGLESFVEGVQDYFFDFWNLLDLSSLIGFFIGFIQRWECQEDPTACIWREGANPQLSTESEASRRGAGLALRKGGGGGGGGGSDTYVAVPWESWSLAYAICLLCCWFRVLRSFYMSDLGLTVSIFLAMIGDVTKFFVMYAILVLAMSMLFLGVGDPSMIFPDCPEEGHGDDFVFLQCRPANFFTRTLFQSFGEFFLEDMNNDASVIFLIITFLILNIVLMNLLIAMMATTYEETSNRAKSKRLEETYNIIVEHTRVAVAAPVPFNVILIVVEFILFLTQHKPAQKKWPDCKFGRMIDLFLSRNTPIGSTPQQEGQPCICTLLHASTQA